MRHELFNRIAPEYVRAVQVSESPHYNPEFHAVTGCFLEKLKDYIDIEVRNAEELLSPGAKFVVAHHVTGIDPFAIYKAILEETERPPVVWVKRNLSEPTVAESAGAVARKDEEHRRSMPLVLTLPFRQLRALFVNQFDVIPVDVAGDAGYNQHAMAMTSRALIQGRIVVGFGNGSRHAQFDLLDCLDGAAYIALRNPDIPIIPTGVSSFKDGLKTRLVIVFGKQTNGATLREESPRVQGQSLSDYLRKLSLAITDHIGPLVVNTQQKRAWELSRKYGFTEEELRTQGYENLAPMLALLEEEGLTPDEIREFMGEYSISPYREDEKVA